MSRHQHVMYASRDAVKQVYSELYGDVNEISVQQGSYSDTTVRGKIGALFADLDIGTSSGVNKSQIKKINFDDEFRQAKKLANEVLQDEEIPLISNVSRDDISLQQIYRFSAEVLTKPVESELDDQKYIDVIGKEGEIKYRGKTSVENWGSRSHLVQSIEAAKRGEPYPYQGLMWPISLRERHPEYDVYDARYLLICGPEQELRAKWHDRKHLQKEI